MKKDKIADVIVKAVVFFAGVFTGLILVALVMLIVFVSLGLL